MARYRPVRTMAMVLTLICGVLWTGYGVTRAAMEVPAAHVHEGSCGALGAVVYELGPATAMNMSGMTMGASPTVVAGMSKGGMATATTAPMAGMGATPAPIQAVSSDGSTVASITDVNASIAKLTGGGYAVNVHASLQNIMTYIACGDLDPATMVGDTAVVALHELNDSGWTGFVVLRPLASGSGAEVDLYLAYASAMAGTPVAS